MKITDAFSRRNLFAALGVGGGGAAAWAGLRPRKIETSLGGPDFRRGHRLWKADFPAPAVEESTDVVIAGGGIAGLAAGWMLADAGFDRFSLLELEDETGGNARGGASAVSAYPLGAHYLPVLNREAATLRRMLTTFGIITGEKNGLPVYDPYQLCADLQERLLWRGAWQEGLIPQTGLSAEDSADLAAFAKVMNDYRGMIGGDGKPAFTLPLDHSSQDPELISLDQMNFARWLDARGWRSPVLRAYVRYCSRDDYGSEPENISAWAGIHYFAARRGWAADGQADNLMTWPEGNAHLARLMAATIAQKIRSGRIVFRAARDGDAVLVDSFDARRQQTIRTRARIAILALPHFVLARVAPELAPAREAHSYAPWLVANVTVDRPPRGPGADLAWDNISSTSASLGYVVATHQRLDPRQGSTVLTWYHPLSDMEPRAARELLLTRSEEAWKAVVVNDLLDMNPDLTGAIRRVDLWRWGHAMIRPTPGFIWGAAREAQTHVTPPFFVAHSDQSGLSLFEEAHHRGVTAAQGAMRQIGHPFQADA